MPHLFWKGIVREVNCLKEKTGEEGAKERISGEIGIMRRGAGMATCFTVLLTIAFPLAVALHDCASVLTCTRMESPKTARDAGPSASAAIKYSLRALRGGSSDVSAAGHAQVCVCRIGWVVNLIFAPPSSSSIPTSIILVLSLSLSLYQSRQSFERCHIHVYTYNIYFFFYRPPLFHTPIGAGGR
jgi:hypothetical protein